MRLRIREKVPLYDLLTYGSSEYNNLLIKMLSDEFYVLQDRVYDVMVEVYVGDEIAGFLVGNFFDEIFIIDLGYLIKSIVIKVCSAQY